MAGIITINFKVIKNGMADLGLKSPIYIPGPVEPQFGPGRYIYFEGFSVDEHGKQHYLDVAVAYRQTTLREAPPPSPPLFSTFSHRSHGLRERRVLMTDINIPPFKASSNTSADLAIATTRSTCYCRVRPSRAMLQESWTFPTHARPLDCRSISSTSISRPRDPRRSWIWERALLKRE